MIAETALRIAGPGSRLVARPAGVAHVYTGPLTPSGRYVPRAGRTVCRAHTRRLAVIASLQMSTLAAAAQTQRLCARCSARLESAEISPNRRAEQPRTRLQYKAAYGNLTPTDLALAAEFAETLDELAHVGHLSLVLFDHAGCHTPITRPDGRPVGTLHQLIAGHRARLNPSTHDVITERLLTSVERRKAERNRAWQEREERIARIGFNNATR